jgi:hypothetical protein
MEKKLLCSRKNSQKKVFYPFQYIIMSEEILDFKLDDQN